MVPCASALDFRLLNSQTKPDVVCQLLQCPPIQPSTRDFSSEQDLDADVTSIQYYLLNGTLPQDAKQARKVVAQESVFAVINDILYFIDLK